MGFFLDIYVEYFFRILFRSFKALGADAWPVVKASIRSTKYRPGGFGCAVAEICYDYRIGDQSHAGTDAKPFLISRSAKAYVEQYSQGSQLLVRVKPGARGLSVVRDKDQWSLAKGLQLDN